MGYSPQGRKELDTTEHRHHHHLLSTIVCSVLSLDSAHLMLEANPALPVNASALPNVPGVRWRAGRGRKPSGLRTVDSTYLDKVS